MRLMTWQPSYTRTLAILVVFAASFPTRAQDSLTVRFDSLVSPLGTEIGRAIGAIPVTSPYEDALPILNHIPGSFLYDFGDTGWADGVSLDGQSPQRPSLSVGGIPFSDLFTERPHFELLPAAPLSQFRLEGQRFGRPGGVNAYVRPFSGSTPITELKFETGQEGLQYVSASHSQTRKPPGLLGGDNGRLSILGHVSGSQSDGLYAGGALKAWQALGRISLTRPGFAATLTEFHAKHTVGARAGVVADFPSAYYPAQAIVLDPSAQRETIRNDLTVNVRVPMGSDVISATTYWTRQHERYSPTGIDTLEAKGNRYGGALAVPFRTSGHALSLRLDGWLDDAPLGRGNPYAGGDSRAQLHATLSDSLAIANWGVNGEVGVHSVGSEVSPAGQLRLSRGPVFLGLAYAGHVPGRIEAIGYDSLLVRISTATTERVLSAELGGSLRFGSIGIDFRSFASSTNNPRAFVADGLGGASFIDVAGKVQRAGGSLSLAWRAETERGFYARGTASAAAVLNSSESDLHRREADALPSVWANGRLGLRATELFNNNLDLDLAAQGRAWSGFRSRSYIPEVALFALPAVSSPKVPTSGVLDLVIEARLQRRATLFLLYENVLSTRVYDGAFIVPVYPLPAHRVRFGLFWTLFG